MRISDMPEFRDKSHILSFEKDIKIAEAVDQMSQRNYGAVLITDQGKLCGIFTERDLLRRVAASRIDIEKTPISEVMTSNLKTAKVDDMVSDCLRRMSQGRFRHMPVIEKDGTLRGMLSQGDFVAYTMSDAIYRAGISAKAGIDEGNSTPFAMLAAILVYTLGVLFVVSAFNFWTGG